MARSLAGSLADIASAAVEFVVVVVVEMADMAPETIAAAAEVRDVAEGLAEGAASGCSEGVARQYLWMRTTAGVWSWKQRDKSHTRPGSSLRSSPSKNSADARSPLLGFTSAMTSGYGPVFVAGDAGC